MSNYYCPHCSKVATKEPCEHCGKHESDSATKTVETPTPRTDAECSKLPEMYRNCEAYTEPVSSDFARQLERELAAMTKERDELRKQLAYENPDA